MFCYYSHLSTELCNISVIQEPPWVTCSSDHMSTLMGEKKKKKVFPNIQLQFLMFQAVYLVFSSCHFSEESGSTFSLPCNRPLPLQQAPSFCRCTGLFRPQCRTLHTLHFPLQRAVAGAVLLVLFGLLPWRPICWLTVLMISVFLKASSLSRQFLHCNILNQEKLESELLGELYDHFMSYICCYYQRRSLIPISA